MPRPVPPEGWSYTATAASASLSGEGGGFCAGFTAVCGCDAGNTGTARLPPFSAQQTAQARMASKESVVHGRITKFSEEIGFGVIEADNGAKYRFAKSEIKNLNGKIVGHSVDFLLAARRGTEIFLMTGTPWTAFGGNGA